MSVFIPGMDCALLLPAFLIDHNVVGGCYLHWWCAWMKYKLWSWRRTVKWHLWKENTSEGRTGQSFPAKQMSPRLDTYPRSQQSSLRRPHGWRADGPRSAGSSQCSHLLARCTHWSHSGWLSRLISGSSVNQWHLQLSPHQIAGSAPGHHCIHRTGLPSGELSNFTALNQTLRTH